MMRVTILLLSICLSLSTCANRAAENCNNAWVQSSPAQSFPQGAGVNIHFTDPAPGEVKMIADAGFRWVRMDFVWAVTEKRRGVYDFSAYDRLIAELDRYRLNAVFILDYGNPLYTKDKAVRTEEARQAFARWSVATGKHFANRGVVWEVFNEPNIEMFWPPQPNVDEYIALALTVGRAFRAELPNEKLIGPATAIDIPFLESCFKAGLLDYWTAVSVHPYRQDDPETVASDYCGLRKLIQLYSKGRDVPIISGEWGYSSVWRKMDEQKQGEMLARQLLTNAANGIPISIWYDWQDDGARTDEDEHHFGLVRYSHRLSADHETKPAFQTAQAVNSFLAGATFQTRLPVGGGEDYVLVFWKDNRERLAAWTTSGHVKRLTVPIKGSFTLVDYAGVGRGRLSSNGEGISIQLSSGPSYLTPIN